MSSLLHSTPPRPLPTWLTVLGSIVAMGHLLVIALLALAPQNGPWPVLTDRGYLPAEGDGPWFASLITTRVTLPYYLQPLRMTHNYHFQTNKVANPAYRFEVRLLDESGTLIKALDFPDARANPWVRHRQSILALGLAEDVPIQKASRTEDIAAPGKDDEMVESWVMDAPATKAESGNQPLLNQASGASAREQRLKMIVKNAAPPGAMRPSDTAQVLAQAYLRYLCREYGAKKAELVRVQRQVITPMELFNPNGPDANTFIELRSHFGEYREK